MSSVKSLDRSFNVDLAINYPSKSFVIIRFGDANDKDCKKIDKWINNNAAADKFAEIYTVETSDVPELVARYSLSGPCTIIFFHQGRVFRCLSTTKIDEERQNNENFGDFANTIMKESTKEERMNIQLPPARLQIDRKAVEFLARQVREYITQQKIRVEKQKKIRKSPS